MPISALVGKRKYMERVKDIFFSFTQGGEALSLAAAIATIQEIEKKRVIEYIWREGKFLQDGTAKLIKKHGLDDIVQVVGKPCWQVVKIHGAFGYSDLEIKSYIQQELLQRGFLWHGQHNMSFSHTRKDIKGLLGAYDAIFGALRELLQEKRLRQALRGKPITNIFKVR